MLVPSLHHLHPPITLAHATRLQLEAGVTAAAPGARAALGTAGLAAEGGVARCHPVCRGQQVSHAGARGDGGGQHSRGLPGKGERGAAWPGTVPMRIPVLCSPNPGTYRSRWGSGSWGLTSLGGRGMCSSGCHPRRSHCWHMGYWSSHQYLGRRNSSASSGEVHPCPTLVPVAAASGQSNGIP